MAGQNKLNICIPTYKRSGALAGAEYFESAKYVLPESQRDEYIKVLPIKRMIVIPDESDGNIAKKRNWILKNIDRPLVMLDDDVNGIMTTESKYNEDGEIITGKKIKRKLSKEDAAYVIKCGFNLADQLGCVYWGINLNDDSRSYMQYKPFSLTGPVLGPFSAHLKHNLFYDERLFLKEDYDISIQLLSKYKKILRINKYACSCKHADNPGGVVSHRTMDRERQQCEAIMRKWGKDIIKYNLPGEKMSDLLNGSVNIPIKGA